MSEPLTLTTADGIALEAEAELVDDARAAMVLCHPHPQYGGTMRSLVIGALFGALPALGISVLRFNFRGVEGSGGEHGGGSPERQDALAALDALGDRVPAGTPLVMTGWSFGADVALSVPDVRLAAWLAIAPPLRFATRVAEVGADARPKVLALAAHDEVRAPEDVIAEVAPWRATSVEVVPGASHFFVGRTDRLVAVADELVSRLTAGPTSSSVD